CAPSTALTHWGSDLPSYTAREASQTLEHCPAPIPPWRQPDMPRRVEVRARTNGRALQGSGHGASERALPPQTSPSQDGVWYPQPVAQLDSAGQGPRPLCRSPRPPPEHSAAWWHTYKPCTPDLAGPRVEHRSGPASA